MGSEEMFGTTYKIFELSPSLLDDTVLTVENDTHTTQVTDFGSAHDQGIDVKSSSC